MQLQDLLKKINQGPSCYEDLWWDVANIRESDTQILGYDFLDSVLRQVVVPIVKHNELTFDKLSKDYLTKILIRGGHPLLPLGIITVVFKEDNNQPDLEDVKIFLKEIYEPEEAIVIFTRYPILSLPKNMRMYAALLIDES